MKTVPSVPTKYIAHLLVLTLVLTISVGCQGEDDRPQFRLTSRERAQVDTLFSRTVDSVRLKMDSICTSQQDSLLDYAVDSLLRSRRQDEEKLRQRILRQQ
jgi:hypothetical protein